MSTSRPTYQEECAAWKARELAKAPPFTQAQLAEFRGILLPALAARAHPSARPPA